MLINRRTALLGGLGAAAGGAMPAAAQDITFFRIGTGATAGTYFPIGGLIANAISNPPGSSSDSRLPLRSWTVLIPEPLRATSWKLSG